MILMKLWMSGEIDLSVSESFRETRKAVEASVNLKLMEAKTQIDGFIKWAFIAIIREEDSPDYDEVVKKDAKRGVLEFRLKLSHNEFLQADKKAKQLMLLSALNRSVDLMGNLGVSSDKRIDLRKLLAEVEANTRASI